MKSWFATSISLLALLISAITVFFNFVWQRDHLEVVLDAGLCCNSTASLSATPFKGSKGSYSLGFSDDQNLVFINSGTRSAVVQSLSLHAVQVANNDATRADCKQISNQGLSESSIPYAISPIPVKAGEAVSTKAVARSDWEVGIRPEGREINIYLCIYFNYITPGNPIRTTSVVYRFYSGDLTGVTNINFVSSPGKFALGSPILLVSETISFKEVIRRIAEIRF